MPNWANNRLTVIGPAERVAAFVVKAYGPTQRYKAHASEIEWWKKDCEEAKAKGLPLPPHPDDRDEQDKKPTPLSFHQLVPIPDAIMAGPYDPGGIDTEHKLWGVKWGATEDVLTSHTPGRADYSFDTPWGPAGTFFETVSEQWRDLLFVVSYSEEYPTRGRFALRGGRVLEQIHDRPEKLEPPKGLSEDRRSDWWRRWQTHYYDRHEAYVSEMVRLAKKPARKPARKAAKPTKPVKKTARMTVKKKPKRKAARR
jgi:hypothetical protein